MLKKKNNFLILSSAFVFIFGVIGLILNRYGLIVLLILLPVLSSIFIMFVSEKNSVFIRYFGTFTLFSLHFLVGKRGYRGDNVIKQTLLSFVKYA